MTRINRRKSIHTPPRRDKVSPSKRERREDAGPTDFTLQRKAEVIGHGTFCSLDDRKVSITGKPGSQARAEFASSSAIALLWDQDKITSPQYRAGTEYKRLHRLLWGRTTPKGSTLSRVMASSLDERLEESRKVEREELDDDAYLDWITEQRTLYERGEYRLRHIAGETIVSRRLIRVVMRAVLIDDLYPNKAGQVSRLRIGLSALADVWDMDDK